VPGFPSCAGALPYPEVGGPAPTLPKLVREASRGPPESELQDEGASVSLQRLAELTGIADVPPREVIAALVRGDGEHMSRESFTARMTALVSGRGAHPLVTASAVRPALLRIFDSLDLDRSGGLDAAEVCAGILVLSHAAPRDRADAVFALAGGSAAAPVSAPALAAVLVPAVTLTLADRPMSCPRRLAALAGVGSRPPAAVARLLARAVAAAAGHGSDSVSLDDWHELMAECAASGAAAAKGEVAAVRRSLERATRGTPAHREWAARLGRAASLAASGVYAAAAMLSAADAHVATAAASPPPAAAPASAPEASARRGDGPPPGMTLAPPGGFATSPPPFHQPSAPAASPYPGSASPAAAAGTPPPAAPPPRHRGVAAQEASARRASLRVLRARVTSLAARLGIDGADSADVLARVRAALPAGSSVVTLEQLGRALEDTAASAGRPSPDPEAVATAFRAMDSGENGAVSADEVAVAVAVLGSASPSARASAVFASFDLDGDGRISRRELTACLASLFRLAAAVDPSSVEGSAAGPAELAVSTAEAVMLEADTDRDGLLSGEEWLAWLAGRFAETSEGAAEEERDAAAEAVAMVGRGLGGRPATFEDEDGAEMTDVDGALPAVRDVGPLRALLGIAGADPRAVVTELQTRAGEQGLVVFADVIEAVGGAGGAAGEADEAAERARASALRRVFAASAVGGGELCRADVLGAVLALLTDAPTPLRAEAVAASMTNTPTEAFQPPGSAGASPSVTLASLARAAAALLSVRAALAASASHLEPPPLVSPAASDVQRSDASDAFRRAGSALAAAAAPRGSAGPVGVASLAAWIDGPAAAAASLDHPRYLDATGPGAGEAGAGAEDGGDDDPAAAADAAELRSAMQPVVAPYPAEEEDEEDEGEEDEGEDEEDEDEAAPPRSLRQGPSAEEEAEDDAAADRARLRSGLLLDALGPAAAAARLAPLLASALGGPIDVSGLAVLVSGFRGGGSDPATLPPGVAVAVGRLFEALDTDGSQGLDPAELAVGFTALAAGGSPAEQAEAALLLCCAAHEARSEGGRGGPPPSRAASAASLLRRFARPAAAVALAPEALSAFVEASVRFRAAVSPAAALEALRDVAEHGAATASGSADDHELCIAARRVVAAVSDGRGAVPRPGTHAWAVVTGSAAAAAAGLVADFGAWAEDGGLRSPTVADFSRWQRADEEEGRAEAGSAGDVTGAEPAGAAALMAPVRRGPSPGAASVGASSPADASFPLPAVSPFTSSAADRGAAGRALLASGRRLSAMAGPSSALPAPQLRAARAATWLPLLTAGEASAVFRASAARSSAGSAGAEQPASSSSSFLLGREAFASALSPFMGPGASPGGPAARAARSALWALFDLRGDGVVDAAEADAAVTALVDVPRSDAVKAAFALFDADRDGRLCREELELCFLSLLEAVAATGEPLLSAGGTTTPAALASAHAEDVFEQLRPDGGGLGLTPAEFAGCYRVPVDVAVDSADEERERRASVVRGHRQGASSSSAWSTRPVTEASPDPASLAGAASLRAATAAGRASATVVEADEADVSTGSAGDTDGTDTIPNPPTGYTPRGSQRSGAFGGAAGGSAGDGPPSGVGPGVRPASRAVSAPYPEHPHPQRQGGQRAAAAPAAAAGRADPPGLGRQRTWTGSFDPSAADPGSLSDESRYGAADGAPPGGPGAFAPASDGAPSLRRQLTGGRGEDTAGPPGGALPPPQYPAAPEAGTESRPVLRRSATLTGNPPDDAHAPPSAPAAPPYPGAGAAAAALGPSSPNPTPMARSLGPSGSPADDDADLAHDADGRVLTGGFAVAAYPGNATPASSPVLARSVTLTGEPPGEWGAAAARAARPAEPFPSRERLTAPTGSSPHAQAPAPAPAAAPGPPLRRSVTLTGEPQAPPAPSAPPYPSPSVPPYLGSSAPPPSSRHGSVASDSGSAFGAPVTDPALVGMASSGSSGSAAASADDNGGVDPAAGPGARAMAVATASEELAFHAQRGVTSVPRRARHDRVLWVVRTSAELAERLVEDGLSGAPELRADVERFASVAARLASRGICNCPESVAQAEALEAVALCVSRCARAMQQPVAEGGADAVRSALREVSLSAQALARPFRPQGGGSPAASAPFRV